MSPVAIRSSRFEIVRLTSCILTGALALIGLDIWIVLCFGELISKDFFHDILPPAVIGAISLLVVISIRNESISKRIRDLSAELRDYAELTSLNMSRVLRIGNIRDQLTCFHARYWLNTLALKFHVGTGPLLIFTYLLLHGSDNLRLSAMIAVGMTLAAFLTCISFIIWESFLSYRTVRLEVTCAEGLIQDLLKRGGLLDANSMEMVSHFGRIFEPLWYVERLNIDQFAKCDPCGKAETEKLATSTTAFFHRYFGMHQEQYQYFRMRAIPREVYGYWMQFCRTNSQSEVLVGRTSFVDGWNQVKNDFSEDFRKYMNDILSGRTTPVASLIDALAPSSVEEARK